MGMSNSSGSESVERLVPKPNWKEVVDWVVGERFFQVHMRVANMRCVRWMTPVGDLGDPHYSVEYQAGEKNFEFREGDTLVFTTQFILHIPKEIRMNPGAEIYVYCVQRQAVDDLWGGIAP